MHAAHLPAAPEHWQGTQEGFLGVRSISAHMACPLWPMTLWRICPCRVLLVPWPPQLYSWLAASCLQGPTGSCTEGASGTCRTAPGTGPSVKGHIGLSARRALGRHQEEMHSLDFTQVKENSLVFFSAKNYLKFISHPPSDSETWFKNKTKHIHHIS